MLLEPPIDELVEKAGNPYKLAVLVGKRAKQLDKDLTDEEKEKEEVVTRAVNEFYAGEIVENENKDNKED